MEARSHVIVEELKTIQSLLATFPVAMPFRVPDGYFSFFSESLKLRILMEENEEIAEPMPSFGVAKKAPFDLPENYFAQFAQSLAERIEEAAFEESLSRKNVFQAPEGYFETFADGVMAAVSDKEIQPEGLSRDMPFAVPKGYFNQFAQSVQERIATDAPPKIIPLHTRKTIPIQVMRWAAAAALIIAVTTGIRQAGTPQSTVKTAQRALASVPEKVLQDYVYQDADDFDADLIEAQLPKASFEGTSSVHNLNAQEIQSFLSDDALL